MGRGVNGCWAGLAGLETGGGLSVESSSAKLMLSWAASYSATPPADSATSDRGESMGGRLVKYRGSA
jgi:hypothetical protein